MEHANGMCAFRILHPMTTIDLLLWLKLPISPLKHRELKLYPKAVSNQDGKIYFRLFLSLGDWEVAPPKGRLYAKYTLRVKDQRSLGKHAELTGELNLLLSYIMTRSWCNRLTCL